MFTVTDEGGLSNAVNCTVYVNNINEPVSFDQSSYEFPIDENGDIGTNIGTISASDPDGVDILLTYTISNGNEDEVFSLNEVTGEISLQKGLDYEYIQSYALEVSVSDGFNTNTVDLFINVNDIHDTIITSVNSFDLAPDGSSGTIIIKGTNFGIINATDTQVSIFMLK